MANRVATRRGPLVRAPRRLTSWLSLDTFSTAIDNSAVISLTMTAAELAKRPFTVVRTHLSIHIQSDQTAASELQVGAVGLCVVSDQAAAIGVTAVPTPETDLESDLWFVHRPLMGSFTFATAVGFDDDGGHHFVIDSKAMRKVNDDEQIIVVVEGGTIIGGGMVITGMGRMLIKES